jgi:predicted transcriptional regulator
MAKPMTIRVDEELTGQLDQLAAATDRPRAWHVEQALRRYVAAEREFLAAVEEGIRAEEAGDVVSHAEAVTTFDEIIAAARSKRQ